MDAERFADLLASLSLTPSRRATVRGLFAGAVAAYGIVAAKVTGDAGKAAKRRRRRRKQARRRRRRCLAACAGPCDFCFYDTEGGIHCADGSGATCAETLFCASNADCAGNLCLRAVQTKGSATIRPLADESCDFPDGLCSALLACAA